MRDWRTWLRFGKCSGDALALQETPPIHIRYDDMQLSSGDRLVLRADLVSLF
jgi:hypothetical protein